MSSLGVEAVLAQVAAVPTVSLPTGMARRKRLAGECEVMTKFTLWHQGGVILTLPFRSCHLYKLYVCKNKLTFS